MNVQHKQKLLILLICGLFLVSLGACHPEKAGIRWDPGHKGYHKTKGGPPPHAPAHGYRAKHTYRYYPGAHVYFDIHKKAYFYLEGGNWRVSVSLPQELRVQLGDHVTIEMDSDKPYTKYKEHKEKYPPGKGKKKKSKWSKKKK